MIIGKLSTELKMNNFHVIVVQTDAYKAPTLQLAVRNHLVALSNKSDHRAESVHRPTILSFKECARVNECLYKSELVVSYISRLSRILSL